MFEWFVKKILNTKAAQEYLEIVSEKMQNQLDDRLKDSIIHVLEDEEIAGAVTQYGDALYDRYQKKFFGSIGGIQKGLNYAAQDKSPLMGLINDAGTLDLSSIVKRLMLGAVTNAVTAVPLSQSTGERKNYKYSYK